jgi:hypothetical protein
MGPAWSAPMQPHHEVLLVKQRTDDIDIFSREAGGTKTRGHGFRRSGHVAGGGVRGVDLNQLFENVVGDLVLGSKCRLLGKSSAAKQSCQDT